MPLYQTKTIANILEPVAQQVPYLHLQQIQRKNVSISRSASWSSFTKRARMATPCPTWRPPWWLWARPWATLSGLWELRIIIHSFFNKKKYYLWIDSNLKKYTICDTFQELFFNNLGLFCCTLLVLTTLLFDFDVFVLFVWNGALSVLL